MGEFQNRAVKALQFTQTEANLTDPQERQEQFLEIALRLYVAIGGRLADVGDCVGRISAAGQFKVEQEIGSMIIELSALSHMCDMDMMQAAKIELEKAIKAKACL
jgi:hypothetical protein